LPSQTQLERTASAAAGLEIFPAASRFRPDHFLLLLKFLEVFFVLVALVHADTTSAYGTQHRVMMGEMTGNGTGSAVFEATARLGLGNTYEASSRDDDGEAKNFYHERLQR
jgi:hypothetical protein